MISILGKIKDRRRERRKRERRVRESSEPNSHSNEQQ